MRNKRWMIVALGSTIALVFASTAISAPAIQTIDAVLGGKATPKFDKKKFKKTSLDVTTTISDAANPSGVPPKATQAVIKFDKKDMKFDTKAAPTCQPAQIENTTTEAAIAACGSAQVGSGSATAVLPLGAGGAPLQVPAVVTAFNRGDGPGILLHSRTSGAVNTTVVIKGTIQGTTLTVAIPPLGGGVGAISRFQVKVQKGTYVQGRCKDKKIDTTSTWTYSDAPTVTATDSQKCKQK